MIKDIYRDVTQGIKNFWFYRKVIWNDRWWDHYFFLEMQEKKLENMSINWKDSHYVDSEEEQITIDRALELTRKLKDDQYIENATSFMDEKYGTLELNEDDSDNTSLFIRGGKEPTPIEDEDWKNAFAEANKNKEADKKELFELIEKNLERWWD